MVVRVGLCQPELGQQAPSVTSTLLARQHWFQGLRTPPASVVAMGAPPISWM